MIHSLHDLDLVLNILICVRVCIYKLYIHIHVYNICLTHTQISGCWARDLDLADDGIYTYMCI